MRRRSALTLYVAPLALVPLFVLLARWRPEPIALASSLLGTALACGALSLPILRPMLREMGDPRHEAAASALVPSASLALVTILLALFDDPTFGDAFAPPRVAATLGALAGIALAAVPLARAWRSIAEHEWRAIAWASLGMGAMLATKQGIWFELLGVVGVQAIALCFCFARAWRSDGPMLT